MIRLSVRFGLQAALLVTLFAGCQTAYYGMMEQGGVEKRDLLKKAVTGLGMNRRTPAKSSRQTSAC